MAGIDGQIEIMVRDVENGSPRQLTTGNAPVWKPETGAPINVSAGFSPDGASILYVTGSHRGRDAKSELYVMDADGHHARPILPHDAPYADYAPNWRP